MNHDDMPRVQFTLPRAARTVSVTGTGGLVLAIAEGWFVDNTAGLCAVVVLAVASMAYDLADRSLRCRCRRTG
ncbi:hypothetical protein [Streptomyces sp. NPDC002328]|uniref:hypothetical protein n=1 Tax=Streptomyces sp. NPDC002328 TaxID=3364642 RepID=UPI0036A6DC69